MPRKDETGESSAFEEIDSALEAEGAAPEERLHAVLTNDQVLAARERARKRVEDERVAKALKRVEQEEVERLRVEEGLTTGDRVKDEIVDIVMDLAPHSDKIVISGKAYHHGFTYPVARHIADTLREAMSRGWQHQDEIDGKNKAQQYAANRQFKLLAKGKAEPSGAVVGTAGVAGVLPKNLGLRPGPEDHARG